MTKVWRALRRRILTPGASATRLEVRGFHRKDPQAQELLEKIGRIFLTGYAYAAEARAASEVERRLEDVPVRFRGFAYEGAAMGFAVRDGLPFGGRHVSEFLAGPNGHDQVYIAYCGIGWAMARLPRFRWPSSESFDPLLRWLVLDGYGFHQAYFQTRKYVHQQFQEPAFPWPAEGPPDYANRVLDQGIGRAMWFVGGADIDQVTGLIERFPASRRPDLYSGTGLAATYAGGATEDELARLTERAGACRPQLAQGSAFAAEARVNAGLVVPHTELATQVLCGLPPDQAAKVTHDVRPAAPIPGALPTYEVWRQRVAEELVSLGGVSA